MDKELVDNLAWCLKQDPKTKHLAKNAGGGLELLLHMARCMDAVHTIPETPKGCEARVSLTVPATKTRINDVKVFKFLLKIVVKELKRSK